MIKPAADDWDQHWDNYAESASHNPAQAYRRTLIFKLLGDLDANSRLLDIGSGQGDFARDFVERYPATPFLGLEVSRSGVDQSRQRVPAAQFVQRDLLLPREGDDEYRRWATHAVCSEVLEHVDKPALLLRNAGAYMKPGCRVVVTVPGGPMSAFDKHIGHRQHFTVDSLTTLLRTAGFQPEFVSGAGFPFFNLYRLVVIARGERLIQDVQSGQASASSGLARQVMRMFDHLFRLNTDRSRRGWQMIAVARQI